MRRKEKKSTEHKHYEECTTLPKATGNGHLVRRISVEQNNQIARYSLAYINPNTCHVDNGRVLGYDNAHGYHHRHYRGVVEAVEFISFEETEKCFQREFERLYKEED